MARQPGFLKIAGTMGGITYTHTKKGSFQRKKAEFDPERLANSPEFEGSRKASSEFGRASRASKLLRVAIQDHLQTSSDNGVVNRLNKAFHDIIKNDPIGVKGERRIADGNLQLMKGFEFNIENKFSSRARVRVEAKIDRSTGS